MEALSDIAVFVQVVESRSFTAAAERLGLSRPAVSKYITRLEHRLQAQLLSRTTRRLNLTEVGQAFYERCRRGLSEIEAAEDEVSRLQEAPRGVLRINTPMSFGILHIAPALHDFQQHYPELSVDMNLDDRQVDLIEEGFDLAIRIAELPESSLVARRLATCKHVVCASPEYLKRHGTPRVPDDLREHNAIAYQYQDSPLVWQFLSADGNHINVPVSGTLRMNNSIALREALLAGAGITLTPSFIVGPDIQAGRLQAVLSDYRTLELSIYAVYPQRRFLAPKVRAFIDYMAERLRAPVYWEL